MFPLWNSNGAISFGAMHNDAVARMLRARLHQ
jgi:hypothetical protein